MPRSRLRYATKFAYSIFFRSSIIVSALVVFLISSYLYGPEGRGVISFVGSFYYGASLLLSFGLARVVYQTISAKMGEAQRLLQAAVAYVYASSLIFLFIVWLWVTNIDSLHFLPGEVKLIHFLLFFGWFIYNQWLNFSNFLFSAVQKTSIHEVYMFWTRFLQIVALAALIFFPVSLEAFLIVYSFSCVLVVLTETIVLLGFKGLIKIVYSLSDVKTLFKGFVWPYLDNVAQAAIPLAIFAIGLFVTNADLGNYHFALQVISGLIFPFTVLQIKIQEWMISIEPNSRYLATVRYLKTAFIMSIGLGIVGFGVPYLLPFVGLANFDGAVKIVRALLLAIPLHGAYIVFQGVWVAQHKPKLSSLVSFIYGALLIASALILAPRVGVWSGPIGTYVGLISVFILNIVFLKRRTLKSAV